MKHKLRMCVLASTCAFGLLLAAPQRNEAGCGSPCGGSCCDGSCGTCGTCNSCGSSCGYSGGSCATQSCGYCGYYQPVSYFSYYQPVVYYQPFTYYQPVVNYQPSCGCSSCSSCAGGCAVAPLRTYVSLRPSTVTPLATRAAIAHLSARRAPAAAQSVRVARSERVQHVVTARKSGLAANRSVTYSTAKAARASDQAFSRPIYVSGDPRSIY
jgi:hypothetical protein